jgi:hypothetical protein
VIADPLNRKLKLARLRVQEIKEIQEVLLVEAEVDKEKIWMRNLTVVPKEKI